jgi:transposase-like protein
MSDKFTGEVKQRAVAEVILGVATMTKVAERYSMSTAYLSILCSRFRRSFVVGGDKRPVQVCNQGRSTKYSRIQSIESRVSRLESEVCALYKLISKNK